MVTSFIKYFLLGIFLTTCFTNTIYGESPPQTITAEGIAGIRNHNKALARDQAIQDALRKAVEQAVGTMISSETMVENYQVLSDKIYAKTSGYIQKYNILSEKTETGLYWVTIQATVASDPLKNDLSALGLLLARKNMPRVMFMIAEQNVGIEQYSFWWNSKTRQTDLTVTENSLLKTFVSKGFHIVDHDASRKQIKLSKAYTVETLANNLIQQIGHLYKADIVIYGKALAKYAGTVQNSSMKSAQADISLRAVNTDTGQVIASASNYSAAVHPSEVTAGTRALRQTAESISDDLIQQIITQFSSIV